MQIDSKALKPVFKREKWPPVFFNEMHVTQVYEGKSKIALVLSFESLMRCKISWYKMGFNEMRMCVFVLNCIMLFFFIWSKVS